MRICAAAAVFLALSVAASAQDAVQAPPDQATVDLVTSAVTGRFADHDAVVVANVRHSMARNGRGYCGEVTVEEGGEATTFHVVFDEAGKASVLVLSDYPDPAASSNAAMVHRLMHNFGCVED